MNDAACALASLASAYDAQLGVRPWYDRVPSASNPADDPSRLQAPIQLDGWSEAVEVCADAAVCEVCSSWAGGPSARSNAHC